MNSESIRKQAHRRQNFGMLPLNVDISFINFNLKFPKPFLHLIFFSLLNHIIIASYS